MDEIRSALLGDRDAQERLTERGVLLPCPHCGSRFIHWFVNPKANGFGGFFCTDCNHGQAKIYPDRASKKAIRAWNARAPILSKREMEMLEGMK